MLEEVAINVKSNHKNEIISLPEENKQNYLPKKKFYNTVFATKMRNKQKNNEKLKKLDQKEVIETCKSVLVEVTRIPEDVVPKMLSSFKQRRKKRKCQWKLGIMKKKRKPIDKLVKTADVDYNDTNVNLEKIESEKNKINIDKKLLETNKKRQSQNDKFELSSISTNETTQKIIDKDISFLLCEQDSYLVKKFAVDKFSTQEEDFSCQRTKPFIGKLNSKEARSLNFNKILSANLETISGEICQNPSANNKNDIFIVDQKVDDNEKSVERAQNIKKNVSLKIICNETKIETKKNKAKNFSENIVRKKTNHVMKELNKTKENFSEKLDESNISIVLDDANLKNSEVEADSIKSICIKSDSSQKVNLKSNKILTNVSQKDTVTGVSSTFNSKNKYSKIIDADKLESSSKKLDDVKPTKLVDNENQEEIFGCRRTEIYYGKLYPQCSRTLPFRDLVKNLSNAEKNKEISSTQLNINISEKISDSNNSNVIGLEDKKIEHKNKNETDESVYNQDWKFKRKILNSLVEEEAKELHVSKKSKISMDKKSNSIPRDLEPASFQMRCYIKKDCPMSHNIKNAIVLLSDVKDDPSAIKYLMGGSKIKKQTLPVLANIQFAKDESMTNSVSKQQSDINSKMKRMITIDGLDDETSKSKEKNIHINILNNDKDEQEKVSKHYLEKKIESEESDSSFSFMKRHKKQSKISESTNRTSNSRRLDSQDWGESDEEVEKFSRSGQAETHKSNQNYSDKFTTVATIKSKSQTLVLKNSDVYNEKEKFVEQSRELNSPLSKISSGENSFSTQKKIDDTEDETDTEMEEISRNIIRSRKRQNNRINFSSPTSQSELYNNLTEEYQEFHQNRSPAPFENTHDFNEKEQTPEKKRQTCSDDESSSSKKNLSIPNSSTKSVYESTDKKIMTPVQKKTIERDLQQVPTEKKCFESSSFKTKSIHYRDLKVQLIGLDKICQNYQDYSASEIEMLFQKHIDSLNNTNFSNDKWVEPIIHYEQNSIIENQVNQTKQNESVPSGINDQNYEDINNYGNSSKSAEMAKETTTTLTLCTVTSESNVTCTNINSPKKLQSECSTVPEQNMTPVVGAEVLKEKINFSVIENMETSDVPSLETNTEQNIEENVTKKEISGNRKVQKENLVENREDLKIMQLATVDASVFTCCYCDKTFTDQLLVDEHSKLFHTVNCISDKDQLNNPNGVVSDISSMKNSKSFNLKNDSINDKNKLGKNKKKKKKIAPRSTDLKCQMCAMSFKSKELLFDHLLTHNEQDLQKALESSNYKNTGSSEELKDKTLESSTNEFHRILNLNDNTCLEQINVERKKSSDLEEILTDELTSASITPRSSVDQPSSVDPDSLEIAAIEPTVVSPQGQTKPVTICSCHAHETANQDLQLEMVLLCQSCKILFRRRECFETHFRKNSLCRQQRHNIENKTTKLFCNGCPLIIDSLFEMRRHLEMHARQNVYGTVTFICNICKVVFFGVGNLFYSHWMNHIKSANFVASRLSFPKISVVSVLEVSTGAMPTVKSQEGFFYVAEHVCPDCKLPFSSDVELQKHKQTTCVMLSQASQLEISENTKLIKLKLVCDLCKKCFTSKESFDKHCIERNHLKTPIVKFSRCNVSTNDQTLLCSLCNRASKTLDETIEHWKRTHSPVIELYCCKTCHVVPPLDPMTFTYDKYDKFEEHCLIHKNDIVTCHVYFANARYVCEICKLGFDTEKSLTDHKTITHEITAGIPDTGNTEHSATIAKAPFVTSKAETLSANIHQRPVQRQIPFSTTSRLSSNNQTVPVPTVINATENSMLRNILNPGVVEQSLQSISPIISNVETIFLDDSRSNSPSSDNTSSMSVSVLNDKSNKNVTAITSSNKNSVMTVVNPDFEIILGNSKSSSESTHDKTNLHDVDDISSNENITPTPFEVVLLNDDLSDNPEDPSAIEKTDTCKAENKIPASIQKPQVSSEIATAKSFLRVRPIAELQSIKIHTCKICNSNFPSPQELAVHSQMHRSMTMQAGMPEYERSTPVQMISPMITPNKKQTPGDPQSILMNQMRQNISTLASTGSPLTGNSDFIKVNSPTLPALMPIQQNTQNQQQSPYWFASCNGSNNSTSVSANYHTPRVSQNMNHIPNLLRKPNSILRGPPPAYPENSSQPINSGRSSSIQLPERNIAAILPSNQHTHRPSGAATRIPQQSYSNFEEIHEYRVQEPSRSYTCNTTGNATGTPIMSQMLSTHPQRLLISQQPMRSYGRQTFSNHIIRTTQKSHQQLHLPQQLNYQPQQQSTQKVYYCNFPNCNQYSDNLDGLQIHERLHSSTQFQETNSINPRLDQQESPTSNHVSINQISIPPRQQITNNEPPDDLILDNLFFCEICKCYCLSKNELEEHVQKVHHTPNGQVFCYVCDYCSRPLIFETEALLRSHMDERHNHSCKLCRQRYPSKSDLKLHIELNHT